MTVYKPGGPRLYPLDGMTAPSPQPSTPANPRWRLLRPLLILGLIFTGLWGLHLPLLKLPYYWDEAGYFVPAAHDIYTSGRFIPFSTLSNAHPPLLMAYLALAWKVCGFHHIVTRTAMLLVSAVALLGVFCLARRVVNLPVAVATVLCTAIYPVFFAQSSLAHLDMLVTALTMWALVLYLPAPADSPGSHPWRRTGCIVLLALAAVTKETAVLIPATLFAWEVLRTILRRSSRLAPLLGPPPRGGILGSLALLLALLPLTAWFAYHHARTGYTFGNPEYVRYNVGATLNPARVYGAFTRRVSQVTRHMNLWALTLAGLLALAYRPKRPLTASRPGVEPAVATLFILLILAHVAALSLVGGAVLARYLLPVLPLLVLLWVAVIWRCTHVWGLGIGLVCVAFAWRCEVNPVGAFTWEENLAYRDFILLHVDAARFIARHVPRARVLTAWPATNELTTPMLGYVNWPVHVFPVEDFKRATLEKALEHREAFDLALIYSTQQGLKYDDLKQLLGGRVIYSEERKGQWIAVLAERDFANGFFGAH